MKTNLMCGQFFLLCQFGCRNEPFQTFGEFRITKRHGFSEVLCTDCLRNCSSLSFVRIANKLSRKARRMCHAPSPRLPSVALGWSCFPWFRSCTKGSPESPLTKHPRLRVLAKSAVEYVTGIVGWFINLAKTTYQNTIESTWPASTLGMPKRCYPRIKTQAVYQHVFNIISADRLKWGVMGSLRHDHDSFAFSHCTMLLRLTKSM